MTSTKRGALVVFLALLLFIISFSAIAEGEIGCYTYPGANEIDFYCQDITEEEARAECGTHEDCVFENHFFLGSCNDVDVDGTPLFPQCEVVQCDVDCGFHGLGKCEWLGEQEALDQGLNNPEQFKGERVLEGELCEQTCCRAGQFCSLVANAWECELEGAKRGVAAQTGELENGQCINFCRLEFNPGTVHGCVTSDADLSGIPITLEIQGEGTIPLDANGCYDQELNVGSFILTASADGFRPDTQEVRVSDNSRTELNFNLVEQEGVRVEFLVHDTNGQLLPGSFIRWTEGRQQRTEFLTEDGPIIAEISPGIYQFTAIKNGYTTQSISRDLSQQGDRLVYTFQLELQSPQGISGRTLVDDGNGPILQHGVEILVDNVPYFSSFNPRGAFNIPLEVGNHTLSARFSGRGKIFGVEQRDITIEEGVYLDLGDFILPLALSDCGEGFPAVSVFTMANVQGEAAFNLFWEIPCRDVQGFQITRIDASDGTTPLDPRGGREYRYQDNPKGGLEWGMEYSYEIVALYSRDGQIISSDPFRIGPLNTGDQACQGRSVSDQFCRVGDSREDRQKLWSCTPTNQLQESLCPGDQFCGPLSDTTAICKDAGICSAETQRANPFGLYYDEAACYVFNDVGDTGTYCVYDYTDTTVDICQSCEAITSCFDYKSEGACDVNNCLSTSCDWINATQGLNAFAGFEDILQLPTTFETGQGYCVQEDYEGTTADPEADDFCGLCEDSSNIFENYYCTGEVCGGLGRCYSQSDLTQCNQCGDIPLPQRSCENYVTELECVGEGAGLTINADGSIILSDDTCGWGRCYWDGSSCFKDGNADRVTDCERIEFGKRGSGFCRADNEAPRTSIEGSSRRITVGQTNLTFTVTDNNPSVREVYYCLSPLDVDECATPDKYNSVNFPIDHQVTVNIAEYIQNVMQLSIDGETLALYYYSIDHYYNQEARRSELLTVDVVLPEFDIGKEQATEGVISSVQAYIANQSEPVACDFTLEQLDPPGGDAITPVSLTMTDSQETSFSNLVGRIYLLGVQCEDGNGNVRSEEEILYFDLEPRISIIYPEVHGVVRSQSIAFEAHTDTSALCRLERRDGQPVVNGDFVPDSTRQEHITLPIEGFVEGEYFGTHKIICRNLIDNEEFYDLFTFSLDYTGPETQIHLEETGRRPLTPLGSGWEVEFVESASMRFTCDDDGFGCGSTFYCFGDGCENAANPNYQEFTRVPVTIMNDTRVCYFSEDQGGNVERPVKCGNIIISGHRLTLLQPEPHIFDGKVWGVGATETFDVEFMTEVTTQRCKFSFDPIEDYHNVPAIQTLERVVPQEARYLIPGFPQGLARYSNEHDVLPTYIVCEDDTGDPGPEHLVFLEYDPTAPVIVQAYAEPDVVTQGTRTFLYVETDDKTVCRFEEVTNDVTPDYNLLSHTFPGFEENVLHTHHAVEYSFELLEPRQGFVIAIQCQNGAGELSEPTHVTFTADLTVEGIIISTSPSGRIRETDVVLEVITNKNAAFCEYRDGDELIRFSGEGTTVHTAVFSNVTEQEYMFPVRCMLSGSIVEDVIHFTIDRTAPVITEIDDGNRTCGLEEINAFVYTNEDYIGEYYYELHEENGAAALETGSATFGNPLTIQNLTLIANTTYFVRARVGDDAGNWGEFADSDGVLAVPENDTICEQDVDAPEITLLINESCTVTSAQLHCDDGVGCRSITYGTSDTSESCVPLNSYSGSSVTVTEETWICHEAVDYSDNAINGSRLIPFKDDDGDGIADSCDECPTTTPGRVVDVFGCQIGDIADDKRDVDTDSDGLPDAWERMYSSDICQLDPTLTDSDFNGISDFDEDYDNDGSTNYEEYLARTDPCLAEESPAVFDEDFIDSEQDLEGTLAGDVIGEGADVVAWSLFIIGMILTLGGIAYLVYYYKYSGATQKTGAAPVQTFSPKPVEQKGVVKGRGDKLDVLRKRHESDVKSRERKSVFASFENSAPVRKTKSTTKTKDAPIFSKLADIATRSKKRKVSTRRKKDDQVFTDLKKIAKGRKKK